jgi:hypothetical protein
VRAHRFVQLVEFFRFECHKRRFEGLGGLKVCWFGRFESLKV